jgi:hypothetical protein
VENWPEKPLRRLFFYTLAFWQQLRMQATNGHPALALDENNA